MVSYEVICDYLNIRTLPSISSQIVGEYEYGDIINGSEPCIRENGKIWIMYTAINGNPRYVCYRNETSQFLRKI